MPPNFPELQTWPTEQDRTEKTINGRLVRTDKLQQETPLNLTLTSICL